jgi:hypothetical protein
MTTPVIIPARIMMIVGRVIDLNPYETREPTTVANSISSFVPSPILMTQSGFVETIAALIRARRRMLPNKSNHRTKGLEPVLA